MSSKIKILIEITRRDLINSFVLIVPEIFDD